MIKKKKKHMICFSGPSVPSWSQLSTWGFNSGETIGFSKQRRPQKRYRAGSKRVLWWPRKEAKGFTLCEVGCAYTEQVEMRQMRTRGTQVEHRRRCPSLAGWARCVQNLLVHEFTGTILASEQDPSAAEDGVHSQASMQHSITYTYIRLT